MQHHRQLKSLETEVENLKQHVDGSISSLAQKNRESKQAALMQQERLERRIVEATDPGNSDDCSVDGDLHGRVKMLLAPGETAQWVNHIGKLISTIVVAITPGHVNCGRQPFGSNTRGSFRTHFVTVQPPKVKSWPKMEDNIEEQATSTSHVTKLFLRTQLLFVSKLQ